MSGYIERSRRERLCVLLLLLHGQTIFTACGSARRGKRCGGDFQLLLLLALLRHLAAQTGGGERVAQTVAGRHDCRMRARPVIGPVEGSGED